MTREVAQLWSDALGAAGTVIRYGHWGRAVLAFPAERGKACFSGNYDPASWRGWGERGTEAYFNNPLDYVGNLHGDHLGWLAERVSLLLVCGRGQWEDTTGALESTTRFAALLSGKGIRCELDLWGHDVPHDWPSWRAQVAHHLPRFC